MQATCDLRPGTSERWGLATRIAGPTSSDYGLSPLSVLIATYYGIRSPNNKSNSK